MLSGCHGGQLDDRIIAQRRDCFQAHVAAALHLPFIVLLEQQCADEARDGRLVGEDADHISAPLDLAVEALERIYGMDFRSGILRESHEGEHVGFRLVHQRGELRHL